MNALRSRGVFRFPLGASATPGGLAALAALAAALALYPVFPAPAWMAGFVFLIGYAAAAVRNLTVADRRWVLGCAAAALAIQGAATLMQPGYDPGGARPTAWLDDMGYFRNAAVIADVWKSGVFPELSRQGSLPYLGTLHTGYERVLAGVFYLTGPQVKAGLAANAAGLALLPVLCFLLARTLFGAGGAEIPGLRTPPAATALTPERAAALLCALYPSLYYWGGMLLKDTLLTVLFAGTLLCLLDWLKRRDLAAGAGFMLLLVWVAIFRAYAALSIGAALFVYAFARAPRRWLVLGLIYGLIAAWGLNYTPTGGRYMGQLFSSLASQLTGDLQTLKGTALHFGAAVPRMILAPYAWVRPEGDRPLYALYPGMWYLYLIVYPLALAGLICAIRKDHRLSFVPVSSLLASAFVLIMVYGGNVARQRLYLEIVLFVYAGLGLRAPERRFAFAAVYAGVFLFAAAQLFRLYLRP